MVKELLSSAKRLNESIRVTAPKNVISVICNELAEIASAEVLIIKKNGHIDAASGNSFLLDDKQILFPSVLERLKTIYAPKENVSLTSFMPKNLRIDKKYYAVVLPIYVADERRGGILCYRPDEFNKDELSVIYLLYSMASLVYSNIKSTEKKEEQNRQESVRAAINTLSYSELEAIMLIHKELGKSEGILVTSKVADSVGVTRSVIVNALRKLESAGIIESRSLGMKGTYIKVLNQYLFKELDKSS